MTRTFPVRHFGQSTFRIQLGTSVVYTDPYLTDRVAELEGPAFGRLTPPPVRPAQVTDADWVLVSHDHLDHCDPTTLAPLAQSSPGATFVAPAPSLEILRRAGLPEARLRLADRDAIDAGELRIVPVPAAHPSIECDAEGRMRFLGFVLEHAGRRLYFAGDTSPHPAIVDAVRAGGDVDVAFLPVNERSHYKERRGIVGNMSVREAFEFATELGARAVVPMHYDLFALNSVFPEEIELLAKRLAPPFELLLSPERV